MNCKSVQREPVDQCIIASTCQISTAVFVISSLICAIVLVILLDNHLRTTFWSKTFDNLAVWKPSAVETLWAVAKWSGVTAVSALGLIVINSLASCCALKRRA